MNATAGETQGIAYDSVLETKGYEMEPFVCSQLCERIYAAAKRSLAEVSDEASEVLSMPATPHPSKHSQGQGKAKAKRPFPKPAPTMPKLELPEKVEVVEEEEGFHHRVPFTPRTPS